jgi:hypothetical protein
LAGLVARYLIFLSFTFNSKNNNISQLGSILNTGASVFEGFFQIFSIAGKYFLELSKIPKILICAKSD